MPLSVHLDSMVELRRVKSMLASAVSMTLLYIFAAACQAPPPVVVSTTDIPLTENLSGNVQLPWVPTIAFVSERRQSGNLDIWLQEVDANTPITVTSDEAQDTQPKWSQDGRYLAFRSQWPSRHSTIRIYDAETGNLSEVDPGDNPYDFDWYPDSQGFLYVTGELQIRQFDLNSMSGETVVERGYGPRVSPDERYVAFTGWDPNDIGERLHLIPIETGPAVSVIDDPKRPELGYLVGGFDWSDDSEQLIEARWGNRFSVPLIVIYDKELTAIAEMNIAPFVEPDQKGFGTNFCSPRWLTGSENVVFIFQPEDASRFCVGKLFVSDRNLTTPLQLAPGEDFASPAPAPDGNLLVATRGYYRSGTDIFGSHQRRESSLWIMNQDGSDLRLLTDGPGYDGEAAWRPVRSCQSSN